MSKTLKEHNYHGIDATIIADSKNEHGQRITSFVCTFPRIVLAEFNTHRMLSRNSASSRAVPFKKMLKQVEENPFIPIAWQKDHKGMQGSEYFTSEFDIRQRNNNWLFARDAAISTAKLLNEKNGVTKQLCNRLLEPFKWHTVIVTATEWENFFNLRCPQYGGEDGKGVKKYFRSVKDAFKYLEDKGTNISNLPLGNTLQWLQINKSQAEIHIQAIAELMWDAMNESVPKKLKAGEWHIPFGDSFDEDELVALQRHLSDLPEGGYKVGGLFTGKGGFLMFDNAMKKEIGIDPFVDLKVKIATARCARVSYENFEGGDDYEKDIKLHNRLAEMGHWSPMEHCARAMTEEEFKLHIRGTVAYDGEEDNWEEMYVPDNSILGWSGNFQGFIQYRKMFNNENKKDDRVV